MAQELLTKPAEKTTERATTREPAHESGPAPARGNDRILQLQRTLGNRTVAELIRTKKISPDGRLLTIQTKLVVGAADDPLEHEADHVAQQVVSTPESAVASYRANESSHTDPSQGTAVTTDPAERKELQRSEDQGHDDEEAILPLRRRASLAGTESFEAEPDVETQLNASKGQGSPLPDHLRAYMEPRFGVDFSHVRVHTGAAAEQMNEAVGAQAFTHGSEIYYGAGHHPGEVALTAHELTHVVQQADADEVKPLQRACACEAEGVPCPKCAEEQKHTIHRKAAVADPPVPTTPPAVEPSAAANPSAATPASGGKPGVGAAQPSNGGSTLQPGAQSGVQSTGPQQAAAPATGRGTASASPAQGEGSAAGTAGSSPGGVMAADGGGGANGAGADPAKGGSAPTTTPAPAIDTSSAEGLLTSLAAAPASTFGQALSQATAAAAGVQAREKAELAASLPEIDQPTGMPAKPGEKQVPASTLPAGRTPEPAPQAGGGPAAAAPAATPVATGPLPAAHVSTAAAEPAQDGGGSWWDWLTSKVKSFLASLPTSDPGLSTSAGERPTVSLSGDADPEKNAEYARNSDEEVGTQVAAADAAAAKNFGERDIAPTIPTGKLRSKAKPSAAAGVKAGSTQQPHALPAKDLAEFDAGATPLVSAKVQEQVAKHRQEEEEYHKKSDEARADGEKQIAEEDRRARGEQEALRTQARADVDTGREQWRSENRKIHEDFSKQSSAKHAEVDRQIKDKARSADEQAEKELSDAEKQADAERTKAEAKAAAKKKEADDKPQSWWESVKGAVSSAFDSIKSAINGIFDELRSLVKSIIDKAKSLVVGLIELARSAIVGFIKAFGEFVKGLVSIALAAFPEAAKKARAWIDDKVDKATAAVNKAAEVLKAAAQAILDAVGKVLDAALAVLQAGFNLAFNALELLAKLPFMAMDALGKLVDLLTHFGPFLDGAKKIMDDPSVIIDGIKASLADMIAKVPAVVTEKVEGLAAQFGGEAKTPAPATAPPAHAAQGKATPNTVIRRSPDPAAATAPAKRHVPVSQHLKGIWRHLAGGLAHLKSSWWEELKKVGWNLLWPWPAVWGDLKDIWKEIKAAWASVKALKISEALDSVLTIGQKINSILGNLYGWFFIASVLIGTIIGAFFGGAGAVPGFMAGVAVASEVGEGLLAGLLAVEGSIIVKAIADLAIGNDKPEQDEKDYDKIAGSTLTLAITGAMMVVGEIAAKLAKSVWEGAASLIRGEKAPQVDVKVDAPEANGEAPDTKGGKQDAPDPSAGPEKDPAGSETAAKADAELDDGDLSENQPETDQGQKTNDGKAEDLDVDPAICFPAGTFVSTAAGMRPIEALGKGDFVYAYDFATNSSVLQPVLGITRGSTTTWTEITAGGERIRATKSHPFWVDSLQSWMRAELLTPGMTLRQQDGNIVEITCVEHVPEPKAQATYNLSVDQCENFYVGVLRLLVHNIKKSRLVYFSRPGYRNYVLRNAAGEVYYSGMFGPNTTPAQVQARHRGNGNRFDPSKGDRFELEPGTREYGEARLMEHRLAVDNKTIIGRDGDNFRGNRQDPIASDKLPEYNEYERFKQGCG